MGRKHMFGQSDQYFKKVKNLCSLTVLNHYAQTQRDSGRPCPKVWQTEGIVEI